MVHSDETTRVGKAELAYTAVQARGERLAALACIKRSRAWRSLRLRRREIIARRP
jgi:hypothetical protein